MIESDLTNILQRNYNKYQKKQKEKALLKEYFDIHKVRLLILLRKIADLGLTKKQSKILDIGVYPPFLALSLIDLDYEVEGISSPLEKVNTPEIKTIQLNVETEKLPYKDSTFDLVVFTEIIEHFFRSPKGTLQEIRRVLKPSGYFLITTPNIASLANRVKLSAGQTINQEIGYYLEHFEINELYSRHNREYTLTELKKLVEIFGFQIEDASFFTSYTPNRGRDRNFWVKLIKWGYFFITKLRPSWQDTLFLLAQKP